jgi:predicted anti-sigma-YlaC factor YlaD
VTPASHLPTARDCALTLDLAVAWVDGVLRGEERVRVESHLADCARCRAALAGDAALRRRLRRVAPERAPAALRATIEGLRQQRR